MALALPNLEQSPRLRRGSIVASTRAHDRQTFLTTLSATAPLRLLAPSFPTVPRAAAVCLVTFGGGLVDGDRIDLDVHVERDATLTLFTQSSTKVFRGHASQHIRAKVDDGGTLVLLPDFVAAFEDAHYTQRIEIELGPEASCVVLDGFTSGRPAFGERWKMRALDLRLRVTRTTSSILNDALRLDHPAHFTALARFDAIATLLALGPRASSVAAAILHEPIQPPSDQLLAVASPLARAPKDGAILRLAASSPEVLLSAVRRRLRNLPEIDAVDPFTSRF